MAKNTRDWPSIRISITVNRPASAPKEMNCAMPSLPTDWNAAASGASTSILSNGTMPVTTSDTSTYSVVQMASEPKMPMGMSRWGFLVSSAAVATTSKPM